MVSAVKARHSGLRRAWWEVSNPDLVRAGGLGMERLVEKEGISAGVFLNLEAQMALGFYLHFWKLLSLYLNPRRMGFLPFLHGLLPWCSNTIVH